MNDLLYRIQDACLQLDAIQLIVTGLVSIILGLFLWLGGARYAGLLIGLLGAVVGAFCGLFVSQWLNLSMPIAALGGAVLAAIIAVIFRRTVILILAALIFAAFCGSSYMSYAFNKESFQRIRDRATGQSDLALPDEDEADDSTLSPGDYLRRLAGSQEALSDSATELVPEGGVQKIKSLLDDMRRAAGSNRGMLIMCILLGGALGVTLAYLLKKIIMALCCSIVGAFGVIAGMIALFFAKGVDVHGSLQNRGTLIPIIFIGMVLFGCAVQTMLAAAHVRARQTSEKEKDKEK